MRRIARSAIAPTRAASGRSSFARKALPAAPCSGAARRVVKALFILPDLNPGGAERMTLRLLGDLAARGVEPTLFLLKREGHFLSEVPSSVKLVSALATGASMTLGAPIIVRKLLKSIRDTDVVVGALELEPTYYAYLCGRMRNKTVIGWVRTSMSKHLQPLSAWHRILTTLIYPRLDRVVLLSQSAVESLQAVVAIEPRRVAIIHSYLDWQSLEAMMHEAVPPSMAAIFMKPTVVAVGRLVAVKNLAALISAHASLQASGLEHNLLILGEGPLRGELENLTAALNLRSSVFMPGFVSNPYAIMKAASVFVLASRYEGFPLVLLEALGVGVAAIATDCAGGSREILENGNYGLLVPPDDETALANAIAKLLGDPSLRNHLSSLGPARARTFAAEQSISLWKQLLADVAGSVS